MHTGSRLMAPYITNKSFAPFQRNKKDHAKNLTQPSLYKESYKLLNLLQILSGIKGHRKYNDETFDNVLEFKWNVSKNHTVRHYREQEYTGNGSGNFTDTTTKGDTTYNTGCDCIKLIVES